MKDKKEKEIKVTIVSYQDYTSYDFIDPATYFSMSALQEYYFYHTSDRLIAQKKCNELFGDGRYTVKTSRMVEGKSKQENGGYSAVGSNSRKGFSPQLKKTV